MRWLSLGALLSLGLAGLATLLSQPDGESAPGRWRLPLEQRRDDPFPRLLPQEGGVLHVEAPPRRAVAASVLTAEVLLQLAPDRLAAVHYLAADPVHSAAAAAAAAFGRHTDGTPENILGTRPDLVLTDPFTRAETRILLAHAAVPILRTGDCSSLDEVRDNLRRIGYGMGLDAEVEQMLAQMDAKLAQVGQRAAERSAWRLLSLDGLLQAHGQGSLFDDVVRTVGAVNQAAERGVGPFRKLDAEEVLYWRPDALVVGVDAGHETPAWPQQNPALRVLPCVQRGRIIVLPRAVLASTSHHVAEAAVAIAAALDRWGRP